MFFLFTRCWGVPSVLKTPIKLKSLFLFTRSSGVQVLVAPIKNEIRIFGFARSVIDQKSWV